MRLQFDPKHDDNMIVDIEYHFACISSGLSHEAKILLLEASIQITSCFWINAEVDLKEHVKRGKRSIKPWKRGLAELVSSDILRPRDGGYFLNKNYTTWRKNGVPRFSKKDLGRIRDHAFRDHAFGTNSQSEDINEEADDDV